MEDLWEERDSDVAESKIDAKVVCARWGRPAKSQISAADHRQGARTLQSDICKASPP
jgi:hypothetical protein